MRILITGAQGQLGTELKRALLLMKTPYGELPEVFSGAAVDAGARDDGRRRRRQARRAMVSI